LCPIRPSEPPADEDLLCQPCETEDEAGFEKVGDGPLTAHIDGEDQFNIGYIIDLDADEVIQPATPLPQPIVPTAAQIEA